MTFFSETQHFSLDNFEGPLDLLLHLVLKSEIDIFEISIQEILEQFLKLCEQWKEEALESGADALGTAATLLWVKSKTLLPQRNQELDEEEVDPRFDMIEQLIDYCRFKEMGRCLADKASAQNQQYFRGGIFPNTQIPKPLGIQHLALEDLATLFTTALENAQSRFGDAIEEEEYRISDAIKSLNKILKTDTKINLHRFFNPDKCRAELLVFFLAVLELLKRGEACLNVEECGNLQLVKTP